MSSNKQLVRLTAIAVGAVYTAVLYISGVQLNTAAKQILAVLPTVAPFLLVTFDKWVWKWGWVQRFHSRPQVDGLWKAEVMPNRDSHIPPGGNFGPIESYVIIEQSFWSLSIAQFTKESRSYSRTSTVIVHGESNHVSFSFLYDNVPRQEHRWRSPRHLGACEFDSPQGTPMQMEGRYFTDRFTQGEMTLELVDRTTNHANFKSAKAHADEVLL